MLLLATEVWRHGGIQRYMKMILRIAEAHEQPCDVISVLDDAVTAAPEGSVYLGCGGSKSTFCWEAVRFGLRGKARRIIVGHVGLLPIAWALRLVRLTGEYTLVLHGIEAWQRLGWIYRVAARGAEYIIATTGYTAREFCYLNGANHRRCAVIPLGGDLLTWRHPRSAPERELRLVMVSRLSAADRYKGCDCLLESIRLGLDSGMPLRLQIVGGGDDLERLRGVAVSLGIQDVVRFRGALADSELKEVYDESHVFVMPSKKEGFGIVYIEAMAAGLPCIGANHGGVPEVIEHGETGFLVEYGDAAQIVFYLSALLESAELYHSFSRAARRRVAKDFGFAVMAESWAKALNVTKSPSALKGAGEPENRAAAVVRER